VFEVNVDRVVAGAGGRCLPNERAVGTAQILDPQRLTHMQDGMSARHRGTRHWSGRDRS
jgi:hypothetical protein